MIVSKSCSFDAATASSVLRMISMYFTVFSLVRGAADASLYYPCRTRVRGIDTAREFFLAGGVGAYLGRYSCGARAKRISPSGVITASRVISSSTWATGASMKTRAPARSTTTSLGAGASAIAMSKRFSPCWMRRPAVSVSLARATRSETTVPAFSVRVSIAVPLSMGLSESATIPRIRTACNPDTGGSAGCGGDCQGFGTLGLLPARALRRRHHEGDGLRVPVLGEGAVDRDLHVRHETAGHERDRGAAEAAPGHPRPDRPRRLRRLDREVELGHRDLEVVAHRAVGCVEQFADR